MSELNLVLGQRGERTVRRLTPEEAEAALEENAIIAARQRSQREETVMSFVKVVQAPTVKSGVRKATVPPRKVRVPKGVKHVDGTGPQGRG